MALMTATSIKKVFILRHTIVRSRGPNVKEVGTYTSEERAKQAIERVKHQPGFRLPNGYFNIEPFPVDVDHWTDGFTEPSDGNS
jgi:hypothetical protein